MAGDVYIGRLGHLITPSPRAVWALPGRSEPSGGLVPLSRYSVGIFPGRGWIVAGRQLLRIRHPVWLLALVCYLEITQSDRLRACGQMPTIPACPHPAGDLLAARALPARSRGWSRRMLVRPGRTYRRRARRA